MIFEYVFPKWKRAELAEAFVLAVAGYGLVATMISNIPDDVPEAREQPSCVVMCLEKN